MVLVNPLNDALACIENAEGYGRRQVLVKPSSKVVIKFLQKMQRYGYIDEFEYIDDNRGGKVVVMLNGRLNKCRVITPRFSVKYEDIDKWTSKLLPAHGVGRVIFTTSLGVMDNEECHSKHIGGNILGYFY